MTKVREICGALEEWAPRSLAYDWDKPGLAIGEPDWDVARVMTALTVTPAAARRAVQSRAELIVSHHPLIWDPLPTLRSDNPHVKLCLELAHARVACYAAHTNLDIAPGGVNDVIADKLGLTDRSPLMPVPRNGLVKLVTFVPESHLAAVRDAVCRAGAGAIGAYTHCTFSAPGTGTFLPGEEAKPFSGTKHQVNEEPERRFETLVPQALVPRVVEALKQAHPYETVAYDLILLENKNADLGIGVRGTLGKRASLETFAARVKEVFGLSHVRLAGDRDRAVHTVAVLGGGGGSRVADVPAGIDVYVTGDVGYHDALYARQRGLAIIDAGHAGLESCIVPVLGEFIRRRFPKLRISTYAEPETFVSC